MALTCVDLPQDGGGVDAGRRGGEGDSCLRTADCLDGLRCVQQVCAWVSDAGAADGGSGPDAASLADASPGDARSSDAAGTTDGSAPPPDAGIWDGGRDGGTDADAHLTGDDAGPTRGEGCAHPGPLPRGVGGCCVSGADCLSGMCLSGVCSAQCTEESHCAVTAPSTPFAANVNFHCTELPGRQICLPGSLAACSTAACGAGEACALLPWVAPDGGASVSARCTPERVDGRGDGQACGSSRDCLRFGMVGNACVQGLCRSLCNRAQGCPGGGECVPLDAPGSEGWGACLGAPCGDFPAAQDALCGAGLVCTLSPGPGEQVQWALRCEPPGDPLGVAGAECTAEGVDRCDHRACLDDRCVEPCRQDGDCPAQAPYCGTQDLGGDVTLAACEAPPLGAQACRKESECGILGCRSLGPTSLFSWCAAAGASRDTDVPCDPNRFCPPGSLCLPDDVDGTLRCSPRAAVGAPCTSPQDCRSGACLDHGGPRSGAALVSGVLPRACSSRCQTAQDCGPDMECRSFTTSGQDTEGTNDDVVQPWCVPITPASPPCTSVEQCVRGTACDAYSGACFSPDGVASAACEQDEDCALGMRCGTPLGQAGLCVREGCLPGVSGGGCREEEICVATSLATAECRRACSAVEDCTPVNPELQCIHVIVGGQRGFCAR